MKIFIRFNDDDAINAFETVWYELITLIKGDAWKLTDAAIKELRVKKYPGLKIVIKRLHWKLIPT